MYRRNIAAAAAVLFLSSAVGISAYAAPQKDNSATEAETETETETERQTETETETETETQETEAATEREAGFVSIEEMPFEIETETETESSDQTETETETEQKIESPKVEQTFRFFQVEKKYAVSKRDDVYLYEKKNTKSDKVGKINALGVLHILEEDNEPGSNNRRVDLYSRGVVVEVPAHRDAIPRSNDVHVPVDDGNDWYGQLGHLQDG